MDFFEQVFGFSPDRGTGSLERVLLLLLGIALLWRPVRNLVRRAR
jgi:hypothetical protein